MDLTSSDSFLFAKEGLSDDDTRVARGTVSQEIRLGAGFKTAEFVKENPGEVP